MGCTLLGEHLPWNDTDAGVQVFGLRAGLAVGGDLLRIIDAIAAARGIATCIPSKANRKIPIAHDSTLYRQRHKIENMFGRLKDWRRVHTRYDRCAHTFFSAICIAATFIFWINQ